MTRGGCYRVSRGSFERLNSHKNQATPLLSSADRYGWVIVGAMLLVQTVSSGLGFYNMSVYINRLSAELAAPVGHISFAVSLFFVVGGVAGLYVATLLNRYSVRTVMIGGALISGFCPEVPWAGLRGLAPLCAFYTFWYRQCGDLRRDLHDHYYPVVPGSTAIYGVGGGFDGIVIGWRSIDPLFPPT